MSVRNISSVCECVCASVAGWGRHSEACCFADLKDVLRVFSLTVPKTEVDCEVCVDEKRFMVPVPTEGGFPGARFV